MDLKDITNASINSTNISIVQTADPGQPSSNGESDTVQELSGLGQKRSSTHTETGIITCTPVTRRCCGVRETGRLLGFTAHQPSCKFSERCCLKQIRQTVTEDT